MIFLQIGVDYARVYKVILDSDQPQFGGHGRISQVRKLIYFGENISPHQLALFRTVLSPRVTLGGEGAYLYIPSRTARVLANFM